MDRDSLIKIDNPHSQPRFSAGMLSLSTVAFINICPFIHKIFELVTCAHTIYLYLSHYIILFNFSVNKSEKTQDILYTV